MKYEDYNLLPEDKKTAVLWKGGIYIGKRKTEEHTIVLYQLDAFYVEVFYTLYRKHIDRIECSENTSLLDLYAEEK